ncbi:MAG TPA: biotin/lipoyl-containing protein [Patescibacteria group bacterium]|nr:biotin/lipoyl-containing protein [Patescibacteria group bacterium]
MTDEPVAVPATDEPVAVPATDDAVAVSATDGSVAVPATDDAASIGGLPVDLGPEDASLLSLVDRLGSLLDRSDLSEIAVEAGGTRLVLRKPSAFPTVVATAPAPATDVAAGAVPGATPGAAPTPAGGPSGAAEAPSRPSVKAPLTGVWYGSPAPGSAPFVAVGRELAVGQVIGLIEAMKLFNEIKSDLAGRVVRVIPESGALVKAKQPLIEVEPL